LIVEAHPQKHGLVEQEVPGAGHPGPRCELMEDILNGNGAADTGLRWSLLEAMEDVKKDSKVKDTGQDFKSGAVSCCVRKC